MDRKIIEMVGMHSILYDKSSKDFKNMKKKLQVWEEIVQTINTTAEIVQRRWKVLRDKFTKERRELLSIPSGAASSDPENQWEYYKTMEFLEPFVRSRKTFSNISTKREHGNNSNSSESPLEVEVTIENNRMSSLSPVNIMSPFDCNVFSEEDEGLIETETILKSTPSTSTPTPSTSSTPAPSISSNPSPTAQSPATPQSKRRRCEEISAVDDAISSVANYLKKKTAVDSDLSFGQYVGAELQKLPKRKKNLAKIKIAQILAELDSD